MISCNKIRDLGVYFDPKKRNPSGEKIIVEDVHPYWVPEHETMLVVVEFSDGSEYELIELPADKPHWVKHFEQKTSKAPRIPGKDVHSFKDYQMTVEDLVEYGDWYDRALEVAHQFGFVLAGEAERKK